jgi:hypothetical protein
VGGAGPQNEVVADGGVASGLTSADNSTWEHVQPLGRAAEVQLLGDRHELPQKTQLNHDPEPGRAGGIEGV